MWKEGKKEEDREERDYTFIVIFYKNLLIHPLETTSLSEFKHG